LPETVKARLVRCKIKGKTYEVLTSMVDAMSYQIIDIKELYCHRWGVELGY
jgi:IS4 transposase